MIITTKTKRMTRNSIAPKQRLLKSYTSEEKEELIRKIKKAKNLRELSKEEQEKVIRNLRSPLIKEIAYRTLIYSKENDNEEGFLQKLQKSNKIKRTGTNIVSPLGKSVKYISASLTPIVPPAAVAGIILGAGIDWTGRAVNYYGAKKKLKIMTEILRQGENVKIIDGANGSKTAVILDQEENIISVLENADYDNYKSSVRFESQVAKLKEALRENYVESFGIRIENRSSEYHVTFSVKGRSYKENGLLKENSLYEFEGSNDGGKNNYSITNNYNKDYRFIEQISHAIRIAVLETKQNKNKDFKYSLRNILRFLLCSIENEGLSGQSNKEKCIDFFSKTDFENEGFDGEKTLEIARYFSKSFQDNCKKLGITTGNPEAKRIVGFRTKRIPTEYLPIVMGLIFSKKDKIKSFFSRSKDTMMTLKLHEKISAKDRIKLEYRINEDIKLIKSKTENPSPELSQTQRPTTQLRSDSTHSASHA